MVHDRSEYVQRSAVVRSILVVAVVTVLIFAVCSVLISAFKSLTEVVLILILSDAVLVAIRSAAINIII